MYIGHVTISQQKLMKFLETAQLLCVNSLANDESTLNESLPVKVNYQEDKKSKLHVEEHVNTSENSIQSMFQVDQKSEEFQLDNTKMSNANETDKDRGMTFDDQSSLINVSLSPTKAISKVKIIHVKKANSDDEKSFDKNNDLDEIVQKPEDVIIADLTNENDKAQMNVTNSILEQHADGFSNEMAHLESLRIPALGKLQKQSRSISFQMRRIRKILSTEPAMLPYHLQYMNFNEMRVWLSNEIMRDIAMQGKNPPQKIAWGDKSCTPSFWPEDLWPWNLVTNVCVKQRRKPKGAPVLSEVMRKAIENRFKQLNIDDKSFIDPNYSKEVEIKRMRKRGILIKQEKIKNILDPVTGILKEKPKH